MPIDISGAVKADDVPVEARSLMQKGIWIDTADAIQRDRKRGMVTVMTVKAGNAQELEAEFRRMKNGLQLPLSRLGLRLQMGIVRESPTTARCYMQTTEIEPPPPARRNGRAR